MNIEISYDKVETLDGKRVKIAVDRILSRKIPISDRFKKFITKNSDTVFTAIDAKKGTKLTGVVYELAEDTTPVKWLFYSDDLAIVGE